MADSARSRLLPFAPYAVIGVVHLVTLFTQWSAGSTLSKPLLMPALLLALVLSLRPLRSELALFAGIGILLSWAGDVLLESPGDIGFLLGLGCFLLAHVAYLLLFLRPLRERRPPVLTLLYLLWWVALVVFLTPQVGALLVPVAAYGLVLAASSAAALGANRVAAIGALVFLCSDTILAFKLFLPGFTFWQIDFAIMLLYLVGQGLIAFAAISRARSFRTTPQS